LVAELGTSRRERTTISTPDIRKGGDTLEKVREREGIQRNERTCGTASGINRGPGRVNKTLGSVKGIAGMLRLMWRVSWWSRLAREPKRKTRKLGEFSSKGLITD